MAKYSNTPERNQLYKLPEKAVSYTTYLYKTHHCLIEEQTTIKLRPNDIVVILDYQERYIYNSLTQPTKHTTKRTTKVLKTITGEIGWVSVPPVVFEKL
jgi:hypothetical protein